jgi:hypothetical protein
MHTTGLIESLIGIELAAARGDYAAVQKLVIEAQNSALELERSLVDALHENERRQSRKPLYGVA